MVVVEDVKVELAGLPVVADVDVVGEKEGKPIEEEEDGNEDVEVGNAVLVRAALVVVKDVEVEEVVKLMPEVKDLVVRSPWVVAPVEGINVMHIAV